MNLPKTPQTTDNQSITPEHLRGMGNIPTDDSQTNSDPISLTQELDEMVELVDWRER